MIYDEHGLSEAQHDKALRAMAGRKPKFHPGHYGKKFDYHTCGQCGATISVIYDYCYRCGYRILWENPRCLTSALMMEEFPSSADVSTVRWKNLLKK